jgi:threonyl-tRNA synthetase
MRHGAGRFLHAGRLGAEFVGEDNARHTPVMLHRAILGSLERFIGILMENHAGAFPPGWRRYRSWSPISRKARPITPRMWQKCCAMRGLRVECDLRGEKINYKIREHSLLKRPYIVVVGDKEKPQGWSLCVPGAIRISGKCLPRP